MRTFKIKETGVVLESDEYGTYLYTRDHKGVAVDYIKAMGLTLEEIPSEQLVPEKKKALAYVYPNGEVHHVVEGSLAHVARNNDKNYTRQECFDIESGGV